MFAALVQHLRARTELDQVVNVKVQVPSLKRFYYASKNLSVEVKHGSLAQFIDVKSFVL